MKRAGFFFVKNRQLSLTGYYFRLLTNDFRLFYIGSTSQ